MKFWPKINDSKRYRLLNKTAVVTGGSSGIGKSICSRLASEGALIVILDKDRNPREGGDDVLQDIVVARNSAGLTQSSDGPVAHDFILGDVLDSESISKALNRAKSFTGRLDILVNNAARVSGGHTLLETTPDEWDSFMSTNVKGAFLCTQAAVKMFMEQEPIGPDLIRGKVINITSQHGIVAAPENIAYGCSKAALNYMTKQIAVDYIKHGIIVNAVAPGRILTGRVGSRKITDVQRNESPSLADEGQGLVASEKRTPHANSLSGRLGSPDDVAKAVAFLASDYSSYTVGETLVVDGGYLAS